jgi:hypothetical protein
VAEELVSDSGGRAGPQPEGKFAGSEDDEAGAGPPYAAMRPSADLPVSDIRSAATCDPRLQEQLLRLPSLSRCLRREAKAPLIAEQPSSLPLEEAVELLIRLRWFSHRHLHLRQLHRMRHRLPGRKTLNAFTRPRPL